MELKMFDLYRHNKDDIWIMPNAELYDQTSIFIRTFELEDTQGDYIHPEELTEFYSETVYTNGAYIKGKYRFSLPEYYSIYGGLDHVEIEL